jgi:hypothetical protein
MWHNLAQHVEKTVARHRGCLRDPEPPGPPPFDPTAGVDLAQVAARRAEDSVLIKRTRERYAAVQAMRAEGKGIKPIMRELGLAKETVRRFYRASSVEELLAKPHEGRPSILDPFKPYLHPRWPHLRRRSFRGDPRSRLPRQRRHRPHLPAPLPPAQHTPPPAPAAPKVRDLTSWLLHHPGSLEADEQLKRKEVLARCPDLDAVADHVAAFAGIMAGLHSERLHEWIAGVEADQLPDLHSFTAGLKRDLDAVVNGLSLPYSSGAVEGNVNRIKMLKRQMYGRASFDLLRKRVLLVM